MSAPIILDCDQGSAEWEAARLGVATASMCAKILTPTGRLSSSRDEYVGKLLAEWALGEPVDEFGGTYHTERGKALEGQALAHYRFQTGLEARSVGFVFKDGDRLAGCSPDALVGDDGRVGVEVPEPRESPHLVAPRPGDGRDPEEARPAGSVLALGDGPEVVGLDELPSGPAAVPDPDRAGPEVAGRARCVHARGVR